MTLGNLLPLDGATGRILAATIDAPYPLNASKLGAAAGVSRFAASRALATLQEDDLVQEAFDRSYAFNPDHPLADVAQKTLWQLYGCKRPDHRRQLSASQQMFHRYENLTPDWVMNDGFTSPPVPVPHGPSMLTVRATLDRLAQFVPELFRLENIGQDVFGAWHNERFRDLIHLTLHLGTAAYAATAVLEQHSSMKYQGNASPLEVGIHPDQWGRAIYLLNAEAHMLRNLTTLFEESVTRGQQIAAARRGALGTLARAAKSEIMPTASTRFPAGGAHQDLRDERELAEQLDALKRLVAANQAFDRARQDGLHHRGGMPGIEEFGRGGDMMIAVSVRRLLEWLLAIIDEMKAELCWATWSAERDDLPPMATMPGDPDRLPTIVRGTPADDITDEELAGTFF